MKKRTFCLINDLFLLILFVVVAFSGLVLKFFLPRGSGHVLSLFFLREDWLFIHDVSGMLMILFTLIHVVLYWRVLIGMIKCSFRKNE